MRELIDIIESKIEISDLDKKHIYSIGKCIRVKKKKIILTEGQTADKLFFIKSGILRSYLITNSGDDLTSEITPSLNFLTSFESFGKEIPSNEFIETLTDCELVEISKKDYLKLFNTVKEWPLFCNYLFEQYVKKSAERISSLKNLSAKERYNNFVSKNPEINKSVPIKHLASFLGIKPQSLSRIRKLKN